MHTDPVGDMINRLRNAAQARRDSVELPASNVKVAIARVLKEEGFIGDFDLLRDGPKSTLRLWLGYTGRKEPVIGGVKRVSKPGLRVYAKSTALPRVRGGIGAAVVSTPQGVMTARQARRLKLGGEVLFHIW